MGLFSLCSSRQGFWNCLHDYTQQGCPASKLPDTCLPSWVSFWSHCMRGWTCLSQPGLEGGVFRHHLDLGHGFCLSWHHKGNGQGHSEHLILFAFGCLFLLSIGNGFRIMPCTECVSVCLRNKLHRNPPSLFPNKRQPCPSSLQSWPQPGVQVGLRWCMGQLSSASRWKEGS